MIDNVISAYEAVKMNGVSQGIIALFPGRHELLYHDDNGDKGTKGDDPLADAVHLDGLERGL